ncbi:MAG: BrnA antitoxin family protein [Magnetococcales bacterium]|nr:BrnA antitoxin family protein [Magnetococcales bacterium]
MTEKSSDTKTAWVDPDDAPELTEELLDDVMKRGVWSIGERVVSREEGMAAFRRQMGPGRPAGSGTKISTTVRFDAEVISAFRATGKGWQTRMNDALRDWLKTHSPA